MSTVSQYLRYPFSMEARRASQRYARDVSSLVSLLSKSENNDVIDAAEQRVYAALTQSEIHTANTADERAALVYTTARLIVEKINNPRLKEYQAEGESKAVNKHLGRENEKFIISLAESSFDWNVESVGDVTKRAKLSPLLQSYELRIRYEDFLDVAPTFQSAEWKLVNRYLDAGWVPVRRSELCRLMSGRFKQLILDSTMKVPNIPERLAEAVQRIESELGSKIMTTEPLEITGEVTTAFPPCITAIHQDSSKGKNLSHEARFALAAFLLKIGMSDDDVLAAFKTAPDFMHGLAEYQVRHIASKSSGEGYTPPGCRKMQSNGLCPVYLGRTFDPLCEYVSHPLAFYSTRAWEVTKGVQDRSWYSRKRRKKQSF
ncbi:MAG: hypothetical protein RTU30_01605 [Candidatus Thorarchaeota archaeon]